MNKPLLNLTEKDMELIDSIYCNMINRGIIEDCKDGSELDGIQRSELNILAIHIKKNAYEEISDLLLQKSLDFKTLNELSRENVISTKKGCGKDMGGVYCGDTYSDDGYLCDDCKSTKNEVNSQADGQGFGSVKSEMEKKV